MTSGKPLRIAICAPGVFPQEMGGYQRHTRLLAEHLARRDGVEVTVVHPHDPPVFDPRLGIREIQVTRYQSGIQYVFDRFGTSRNFLNAAMMLPSDTLLYGQGLALWSGARSIRERFLFNPHGLEPFQTLGFTNYLKYTPLRLASTWLFRNTQHIVSLGGRLTDIINRHKAADARVYVLPNAVEVPATAPAKTFAPPWRFLFVGRHFHNKGIRYAAEAAHILNAKGLRQSFQFDFIGDGPELPLLRANFSSANIHFHGKQPDSFLGEMITKAHLFVFPTLFEGMPTVVMEAMAVGTPIAVTDTGATLELLGEDNGFLLRKRDSLHVADTLMKFMQMPSENKHGMGQASRRRILDQFTWEVVANAHLHVFKKMRQELLVV